MISEGNYANIQTERLFSEQSGGSFAPEYALCDEAP